MRVNGEKISNQQRNALWPTYYSQLFSADDDANFLAILPASDHITTFEWLYPQPRNESDIGVWRYCLAVLRANAGDRDTARN